MTWILAGGALGLLSRFEEASAAFDLGISTSCTWLAVAFAAGLAARRLDHAAALGALTLSSANAAYYLRGVYGPFETWIAFGVAAGAVFGVRGHAYRSGAALAAAIPLVVGVAELSDLRLSVLGLHLP